MFDFGTKHFKTYHCCAAGGVIGLSFYLVILSWSRCEELTVKLNQELQDFRELMGTSDNEE